MKFIGIKLLLIHFSIVSLGFQHILNKIPETIQETDYIFIVEIQTQKNYLFYKKTLLDIFSVSTGSKTRYKGNREMKEGIWRLGQRIDKNLAPIYGARLIYLEKYNKKKSLFAKTNKAFHGTNEPFNIGKPTSMGCVYHFDNDIIDLYSFIPKNTLVISVNNIADLE